MGPGRGALLVGVWPGTVRSPLWKAEASRQSLGGGAQRSSLDSRCLVERMASRQPSCGWRAVSVDPTEASGGVPRQGILLAAAMFVFVIDTSFMNVSISAVVHDLDTTVSGVQSAVAIEALVSAAFILISSKVGDLFGRKRAFVVGHGVLRGWGACDGLCAGTWRRSSSSGRFLVGSERRSISLRCSR